MIVKQGDVAQLSTGELLYVTSAVDQEHPNVKNSPDDLFLGYRLRYSPVVDRWFYNSKNRKLEVSSMSEVVAVRTDIVIDYGHGNI
jgi:hypothetical protein